MLLATINLPKSLTFLGNFCKGVKIYHFSSEIIFWANFIDIWRFFSGHTDYPTAFYAAACLNKSIDKFSTTFVIV